MPELFTVVTPNEALSRFRSNLTYMVDSEEVKVNMSAGRVVAKEIYVPTDLPSFPRSTMDGYAVIASDTYGSSESIPSYLNVIGEIPMGQPSGLILQQGKAALVHTGGMLAEMANAVVMVENTQVVNGDTIEVMRPVAPGENVLQIGDDVKTDQLLFSPGHILRPQDIGGLMGLKIDRVTVSRRPRITILSTGDELISPDQPLSPGKIRDINTYSLSALALQVGAIPNTMHIIADSYDDLRDASLKAIEQSDMLVISAGSSVSTRDITAKVIGSLGEPGVIVHGVSIKPGKPTILASISGKPSIGLPGNPVSALVIFDIFAVPAMYWIAGCEYPPERPSITARLTQNIASVAGREDYVAVRLESSPEEKLATPIFGESNLISTMIKADGMAKVPLDKAGLVEGALVSVRLFQGA